MKYLLLLLLVIALAGCTSTANGATQNKVSPESLYDDDLSFGVHRVRDGNVTCYIYSGYKSGGISCLRDATSSGEAR